MIPGMPKTWQTCEIQLSDVLIWLKTEKKVLKNKIPSASMLSEELLKLGRYLETPR